MPKLSDQIPECLTPYKFHRLDLRWDAPGTQATGDCPFCGGDKFFVGKDNGVYSCKKCDAGYPSGPNGNVYSFIRKLYQESTADVKDLELVAEERGISVAGLQRGGLVKSLIDNEWMLPGYGDKGEVNNLYRWSPVKQSDGTYKRKLLSTTTLDHCLFGIEHWDPAKPDAYILEGPWDMMKFEDVLETEMPEVHSQVNFVACPGSGTFKDSWVKQFVGKNCVLFWDNDHLRHRCKCKKTYNPLLHAKCPKCGSREVIDKRVLGAGYAGVKMAAAKLFPVAASIRFLDWGEDGMDATLPDGFDVRDYLNTELAIQ